MTEPMNEERAKGVIEKFKHLEPVLYDPALDRPEKAACRSYVHAKGYLERVEQTKDALEAADRMADYLEDDPHLNKNSFLLAYRAARAKLDKGEPGK